MTEPITALIQAHRRGDPDAVDRLYPLVQSELRRGAAALLRRERDAQSVQATELVNDALLRLLGATPDWQDRAHFLAVASRAMRQILVDRARRRQAQRRGGGWQQMTLGDAASPQPVSPEELIALDEALDRLGAFDRRLRDVVEYRYFGGLTDAEVAEALGVTERTVQRDWKRARALLHADLYPDGSAHPDT
jgi:RNA polymerase sigma factor (TIGR02999 family)